MSESEAIRKELKSLGYSSRKVSVRTMTGANCFGTYITVKDKTVDVKKIKEIADKYTTTEYNEVGDPYIGCGSLHLVMDERGMAL